MNPEIIERLIQTEDDTLLNQVQAILESLHLSEQEKQELDKRMDKYSRGESKVYDWAELRARIRKTK